MELMTLTHKDMNILIYRKPNPRAKYLSLRPESSNNTFILTIPPRTSEGSINKFLIKCKEWIEKYLHKMDTLAEIEPGREISLLGTSFRCIVDPLRRRPILCSITHTLRLPPKYTRKALHETLKKMAEENLTPYVHQTSQRLNQSVEKVVLRDTKTRWGSCSTNRVISLSWRLVLAPLEVAHYVCVHEVVHLLHMNHSAAFWKKVEELCPTHKIHRKWLKTQGFSLMGI